MTESRYSKHSHNDENVIVHDKNDDNNEDDPNVVNESQIRKMTRLAMEYQAVNLSQGTIVQPQVLGGTYVQCISFRSFRPN